MAAPTQWRNREARRDEGRVASRPRPPLAPPDFGSLRAAAHTPPTAPDPAPSVCKKRRHAHEPKLHVDACTCAHHPPPAHSCHLTTHTPFSSPALTLAAAIRSATPAPPPSPPASRPSRRCSSSPSRTPHGLSGLGWEGGELRWARDGSEGSRGGRAGRPWGIEVVGSIDVEEADGQRG